MLGMEISPRELRTAEIPDSFRGYNRDVVDEFLERAAATVEALQERNRQLTERLQAALAAAEHATQQPAAPEPQEASSVVASAPEPTWEPPEPVAPPEPVVVPEPVVASVPEPAVGTTTNVPAAQFSDDLIQRTLLMAQRAADETISEADKYALRTREDANTDAARTIAEANNEAERISIESRAALQQALSELEMRREALEDGLDLLERFDAEYRARLRAAIAADLEVLDRRPVVLPGERPAIAALTIEGAIPAAIESVGDAGALEAAAAEDDAEDDAEADSSDSGPATIALDMVEELGDLEDRQDVLDDDAFFASLREAVHDDAPLGPSDNDGGLFPR